MKANHPDIYGNERAKIINERWKEASEQTKKPYIKKAEKLKEEYHAKLKEYKRSSQYKKWKRDMTKWNEQNKMKNEEAR